MKLKAIAWGIVMAGALGLAGCTPAAQKDKGVNAAPLSEEEQQLVLTEQQRLDSVEQQRTGDASAYSCRKAKEVYAYSNTKVLDTNGCSAEQLKLEQDAEQKQARDKAMADAGKRLNDMREKMEHNMKPVKGHDPADQ